MSFELDSEWAQSEPIYINTDIKRKISNSYGLPVEGHIVVNLQTESEVIKLLLTSSIESKMRLIVISSLVVVANHSKYPMKIYSFVADVGEKLDGVKRNEVPTKKYKKLIGSATEYCIKGHPLPVFTDICRAKGKRKFNGNFSSLIAIGEKPEDASFPIKIQPMLRRCLNVPTENENVPVSVSIIKHNEQYFVSIHDDPSPFFEIRNDTDFNLFVAQSDLSNPTAKYVLPHKEVADERFNWFQAVPSKHKIFYTPPSVNEHFPEIANPDYGLIFACVSGDDFIRWSQPVKIDGTKKIIINVPMFGDVKLNVDGREKTTVVTIGYIQNEKEDSSVKSEPTRESFRAIEQQSFLEVNSSYQKTFCVQRKPSAKAVNINVFSKGVSLTVYKEGDRKRDEQISLNVDEIGVKYSKLACKLKINFAKIQVDNELYSSGDYDFPVVLCNKNLPKELSHDIADTSVWDLNELLDEQQIREMFAFDLDLYESGDIENITVELQPIRLYIEDTFINVFLEIVDDCLPTNLMSKSNRQAEKIKLANGMVLIPSVVVAQSQLLSEPLRLKSVRLEPLHILLSVHTCMR